MASKLRKIPSFDRLFNAPSEEDESSSSPRSARSSGSEDGGGGAWDGMSQADLANASSISSDGTVVTRRMSSIAKIMKRRSGEAGSNDKIEPLPDARSEELPVWLRKDCSSPPPGSPHSTAEEALRMRMVNSTEKYLAWFMIDHSSDQERTFEHVLAGIRMVAGHVDRSYSQPPFELYVPTRQTMDSVEQAFMHNKYRGKRVWTTGPENRVAVFRNEENGVTIRGLCNVANVILLSKWRGALPPGTGDVFIVGGYDFDEVHVLGGIPRFMQDATKHRWEGRLRITAIRHAGEQFPTMPVTVPILMAPADEKDVNSPKKK